MPGNVEAIRQLVQHPAFNIQNPNNCYSLFLAFARSPVNFHAGEAWAGEGCGRVPGAVRCVALAQAELCTARWQRDVLTVFLLRFPPRAADGSGYQFMADSVLQVSCALTITKQGWAPCLLLCTGF